MNLLEQALQGAGGLFGGASSAFAAGQQPHFGQQTTGAQMRNQLLGGENWQSDPTSVGMMQNQSRDYYQNLMQGNVPQAMRQNIMGAGQDLAAQDAMSTQRLLAQAGGAGGGGLGAALGRVSSSNRGNQAMQQLGGMGQQMMQMGQQGFDRHLQDQSQLNTAGFNLDQSNLRDRNQSAFNAGQGLMGFAKWAAPMAMNAIGGPLAGAASGLLGQIQEWGG